MTPFLDQIRRTVARYGMLRPGRRLGVAVSGGADSVCLLHVLFELRSEFDLHLAVLHVDHNLRGADSEADAQFVHKSAQQLGLSFHLRTIEPGTLRGNLEQEARRARHRFFRQLLADGTVDQVALGHTRSDQAETVLFRFLRGAGTAGLAGVRPVTDSGIVRPLIQVTRPQVEEWLDSRGISWRDDRTNRDERFRRNRIRHRLLPALESEWNPELSRLLAHTADWAYEEERYWRDEIPRLAAKWVRFCDGAAVLDAAGLNSLPVAPARRLVRDIIRQLKGDLLGVDFSHIEAIRELAAAPGGSGQVGFSGLEIRRSFEWLRFSNRKWLRFAGPEKAGARECNWEITVVPPCRSDERLPSPAGFVIELELVGNSGVYNRDMNALDWQKAGDMARHRAGDALVLRNWRPGDQYQRVGHSGPEKIKKLFQESRIPVWERENWPVISAGNTIIWARKFGPAEGLAVGPGTSTVLRIRETFPSAE